MQGLVKNKISKAKKSFFRTFCYLAEDSSLPRNIGRVLFMFSCLTEHLNYLSLLVFSGTLIPFYYNSIYLPKFLAYTRFDIVIQKAFGKEFTSFLFLAIVLINLSAKLFIFLQFRFKFSLFMSFFRICSRLTSHFIMHAIRIPIIRFCVNNEINIDKQSDPIEYQSNSENSNSLESLHYHSIYILTIIIISSDLIFGNFPNYNTKKTNFSCSVGKIKEFFCILILTILGIVFDSRMYFVVSLVISLNIARVYYNQLPYYNTNINIFYIQNWLSFSVLSFLMILSEIYKNFYVIEVVFPFLYLTIFLLTYEAVSRRIQKLKSKFSTKDPYTSELTIRYSLFFQSSFSDHKSSFKSQTKTFFEFNLQYIWESVLTLKYSQDRKLALMKLAKVSMSKYKQNLVETNYIKSTKYPLNIETEFYTFCLFNKIVADYPDACTDILLINFFYDLNDFKQNEADLLHNISELCLSLANHETSGKQIEKMIGNIGENIKKHQEKYFKSRKKFGFKKEFQVIFQGFCNEIVRQEVNLNIHKSEDILKMSSNQLNKKISNVESGGAILIVSGNHYDLGTILYANSIAYDMLGYGTGQGLAGMCFTQLIPPPFDVIHKNVLMKFIMFSDISELQRSHFCILDKNRFCIEVAMTLKLSFYKGNAYFITKFQRMLPEKNLILTESNWNICGFSYKVHRFFENFSTNLLSLLPNIQISFSQYKDNETFIFEHPNNKFVIRRHVLKIDQYELCVIYIDKAVDREAFDIYGSLQLESIFNNQNNSRDHNQRKEFHTDLENNDSSFKLSKKIQGWDKNMKIIKYFSIFIKIFVLAELLVLLAILLIVMQFSQSKDVSSIVFNIGLMRYLSISTLSSIQSLDLIQQNYKTLKTEDYYREVIKANSVKLDELLKDYDRVSLPFKKNKMTYFDNEEVEIYYQSLNGTYTDKVLLFDCVKIYIKHSYKILNTSLDQFKNLNEELEFIYRNIPGNYIKALNKTVFEVMKDITSSEHDIFNVLFYCELVLVFLPASLVMMTFLCLISLEQSNRSLWYKIDGIDYLNLSIQYNKVRKRLKNLHQILIQKETFEKISKREFYTRIIWKPLLKVSLLFIISLGIYFNSIYGPELRLQEIIFENLNHINFGGLRRMMTPLTLYWARATYFDLQNYPINNFLTFNTFSSPNQTLSDLIEDFKSIQSSLMKRFEHEPLSLYSFTDYIEYMYGSTCSYLDSLENCQSSIVGLGVQPGFLGFIHEISRFNDWNDKTLLMEDLNSIERHSYSISSSFVYALQLFSDETDKIIEMHLFKSQMITMVFCFCVGLYYLFIGHWITENIKKNLEDRAFVAGMFF